MSGRPRGPVRGRRPWPEVQAVEVAYGQPAGRQHVPYRCQRGHGFALTFLAGILPPAQWECRCGAPAAPADDRPAAAPPEPRPPRQPADDLERRLAMVLQRRSRAELETALAERIAALHRAAGGEAPCGHA